MIGVGIAVPIVHASADLRIIFRFGDLYLFILCEQFADGFANRRMPVNGAIDRVIERQVARRGALSGNSAAEPSSEGSIWSVANPSDVIIGSDSAPRGW